jgi:hypothetical protein
MSNNQMQEEYHGVPGRISGADGKTVEGVEEAN